MCLMNELIHINDKISYIPASEDPLSSEVVFIESHSHTYIYDVGRNKCVADYILDIHNPVIILSHFHGDHIENISRIGTPTLYVSKQTSKYTHFGELILENKYICDGDINLRIFPLPSSHAKGCLGLEVNGEFAFLGDAVYGMSHKAPGEEYNYQLLQNELQILKTLLADKIYLSHRFSSPTTKKGVLSFLEKHLSK